MQRRGALLIPSETIHPPGCANKMFQRLTDYFQQRVHHEPKIDSLKESKENIERDREPSEQPSAERRLPWKSTSADAAVLTVVPEHLLQLPELPHEVQVGWDDGSFTLHHLVGLHGGHVVVVHEVADGDGGGTRDTGLAVD